MGALKLDETLLNAVVDATNEGLSMTEVVATPIGASRFPRATHELSVLVSLYGQRNGNLTINLTKPTAAFFSARLLGEEEEVFNEDSIDAICEIGNIIAGRYKDILKGTEFEVEAISLPALILGANYNVYHYRGITTVGVDFEIEEISMIRMQDKFFTSSISFMQK